LLLDLLSAYSEQEESGAWQLALSLNPFPDTNEFALMPHPDVALEKKMAVTLRETLHRHAISSLQRPFSADGLLKSLQPMLSRSVPDEKSKTIR